MYRLRATEKVLDKRKRVWYNVDKLERANNLYLDNTSSVAKAKLPVTLAKLEGQMHRGYPPGLVQLVSVASPFSMVKTADVCNPPR